MSSPSNVLIFFIGDVNEYSDFSKKERVWVESAVLSFGLDFDFAEVLKTPSDSYNSKRGQYNAGIFLREVSMRREIYIRGQHRGKVHLDSNSIKMIALGITKKDIYFGNFNFVFGLASPTAYAAVVSFCRLDPEFYGYPPDDELYFSRVRKEVIHELGHIFGLIHCSDNLCVMSFSNSIDEVDRKQDMFCISCAKLLGKGYY